MDSRTKAAVEEVFSDTSVSQTETWDRLQEIIEHCRELQAALDDAEQEEEA